MYMKSQQFCVQYFYTKDGYEYHILTVECTFGKCGIACLDDEGWLCIGVGWLISTFISWLNDIMTWMGYCERDK